MDALPVLELRAITKKFGPVVANDRVDFDLRAGEEELEVDKYGIAAVARTPAR